MGAIDMNYLRSLLNFPLGLAVGAISAFSLAWIMDGPEKPALGEWAPTLFIASCTIVAAALAVRGVQAGIEHNRDLERSRIAAENDAARAILPLTLMELFRLTELAIEYELERSGDFPIFLSEGFKRDTISDIQSAIRVMSGPEKQSLAEIPAIFQVLTARMRQSPNMLPKRTNKSITDNEMERGEKFERFNSTFNWVTLQTLIESLFAYSRNMDTDDAYNRDVTSKALDKLELLSIRSGWQLTNDAEYRERLDQRKQHGLEFGKSRWRRT